MPSIDKPTTLRAIVFALACFMFWAFSDTVMKLAGDAKLSALQIIAAQSVFWVLFLLIKAGSTGKVASLRQLWPRHPRQQAARSMLRIASSFFNAMALMHLPLTLFYVIAFCSPFVVSILAAVVLKERLTWAQILATVAGFAGVVIAVDPLSDESATSWVGVGWMFCSVLCFCANAVWLRVMTQSETVDSLAFYCGVIGVVVVLPLALIFDGLALSLPMVGLVAMMSFFALMGDVFFFRALRDAPAATVEQYHYSQIVIGAVLGYVFWGDIPSWNMVLGAAVIIATGLSIAMLTLRMQSNAT